MNSWSFVIDFSVVVTQLFEIVHCALSKLHHFHRSLILLIMTNGCWVDWHKQSRLQSRFFCLPAFHCLRISINSCLHSVCLCLSDLRGCLVAAAGAWSLLFLWLSSVDRNCDRKNLINHETTTIWSSASATSWQAVPISQTLQTVQHHGIGLRDLGPDSLPPPPLP